VPITTLPFLNVTVPVAAEGVTAAVKVTEFPYVEGFNEELRDTEVLVLPNIIPVNATHPRTTARARNIIGPATNRRVRSRVEIDEDGVCAWREKTKRAAIERTNPSEGEKRRSMDNPPDRTNRSK
jgi:hypothetical protein